MFLHRRTCCNSKGITFTLGKSNSRWTIVNCGELLGNLAKFFVVCFCGYICRYRKALYFGSLGISLYLELFCFLSFISFVLRKLT